MYLKPSDRIQEIRKKLISEDYVQFGGNSYSRASWQQICNNDDNYLWRSLMQFLDEQAQPVPDTQQAATYSRENKKQ